MNVEMLTLFHRKPGLFTDYIFTNVSTYLDQKIKYLYFCAGIMNTISNSLLSVVEFVPEMTYNVARNIKPYLPSFWNELSAFTSLY